MQKQSDTSLSEERPDGNSALTPAVAFDESGNTGADLLNLCQPVFVLASADFTTDEAEDLLSWVRTAQTREPKVKRLRKSARGRQGLVRFFEDKRLRSDRVQVSIYHKRFMVVTKIIDLLIENLAYEDGIDLYEDGANLALAHIHYYTMESCLGASRANRMLHAFVKMFRRRTPEVVGEFYEIAWNAFESASGHYRQFLAPVVASQRIISSVLASNDSGALDPALPSFIQQCNRWSDRYYSGYDVLHDDSKAMVAEQELIEAYMDKEEPYVRLGTGERSFSFPLRANGLRFLDSKGDARVQVADLLASSVAAWANGLAGRTEDSVLSKTLDEIGIRDFVTWCVWPQPEVHPDKLGTRGQSGSHMKHINEFLARKLGG